MKFIDMLQTSANNLWKRKLRSALTIMGVVIGVASIVIMVSLGVGLSNSMMEEYSSYGSITQIEVSMPYDMDTNSTEYRLDDSLMETLSSIEHVESVYPVLDVNVMSIYGGYTATLIVHGMSVDALKDSGVKIGDGKLPNEDMDDLQFFYGWRCAYDYGNLKTGSDYWSTGIMPDIDFMDGALFTVFDLNGYMEAQAPGSNKPVPKKYLIPTCGISLMNEESYNTTDYGVYCDVEKLKLKLRQVFKRKPIPGQPTTKSGKPYADIYYTRLLVNVDEMDNVQPIQDYISDMGYRTYSNTEWIASSMKAMNLVQMVLGGIGAVSLFVAAIGIANTMMMSIYERTKEIGVMKVLGCSLDNIRMMFLLEAAMIGFFGGIIGTVISFVVSRIINYVSQGADFLGIGASSGGLSRIPIWLVLVSIVFAIFISMIAGFVPAQKAMKLSPLAAIRNE